MKKEFKNPSNQYRPIPFWSWNDKLEKEELEFQINEMKQAGVGGFFMHARSGLKVKYLSEEWFDCIKAGIDKAKEVGLDAWAYDEEGWPSGFAGGLIPAMSKDFQSKFITVKKHTTAQSIELTSMLAIYSYCESDKTYRRIIIDKHYKCMEGEVLLAVQRHLNPFYIDTMNKKATEAFIECTHQIYYERFGNDFGGYMKGFFTDEPRLACNNLGELPWSDDLPATFFCMHGYNILEHIAALFVDVINYKQYRYDFWKTVNQMFVQNYMKTIYDWCELHHCKSTGHIMMEESIFSQMTSSGGVMPFYEYLHIPGIDWLRRSIASPIIGKQVGSVACQLGKKQVLTESFALCGWDVSFEELKWIAEWQFVNGVNQLCQHLEGYTIKGVRKRDYPPSLFTQQTWWKEYKKFNDYMGRLCLTLSCGNEVADVLLVHPMRSGFIIYDGTRTEEMRIVDRKLIETTELLSGLHISYHFGDETIIEKYGVVKDSNFMVGDMSYKTVILPHMYAIDKVTVLLLNAFANNGGTIISLGQFPTYTNGDILELECLKQIVRQEDEMTIRAKMKEANQLSLSISKFGNEIADISYLQRYTEAGSILFMVNHSQKCTHHATISVLNKQLAVTRLVAETGEEEGITYNIVKSNTEFELMFEPMQSYIIRLDQINMLTMEEEKGNQTLDEPYEEITLKDEWEIEDMDLNTLTLDTCKYCIDEGEIEGPIPVIKLQSLLLKLQHPCNITLYFTFQADLNLEQNKEFYVIIEEAQQYEVLVNGKIIPYQNQGWWKDKSFKKMNIKKQIQQGHNEILLKTKFKQPQKVYDVLFGENVYETEKNKITYDIEIENIYLLGDFGVKSKTAFEETSRRGIITKGDFAITNQPNKLSGKNFTEQGLLFFAGQVEISQKIEVDVNKGVRVILNYGKHDAPLCKIYLNGNLVKDSLWAPYKVDITDIVKKGWNTVSYRVFASNRNLFGPHHHIDGECYNVGPDSFTGNWSWVERTSEADATDVEASDKNYWTDSYCFVKWGVAR